MAQDKYKNLILKLAMEYPLIKDSPELVRNAVFDLFNAARVEPWPESFGGIRGFMSSGITELGMRDADATTLNVLYGILYISDLRPKLRSIKDEALRKRCKRALDNWGI